MNKILLVSPHFDDAVLSAGQLIAERPDCEVVTVFGGFPTNPQERSTPYDQKCGFKNAEDAIVVRRQENNEALAILGATRIDLGFPDEQYGEHVSAKQIAIALEKLIADGNYEAIYAPIGLGHPDHVKTNEAVMMLNANIHIYLWEDIPLRVVEPHLVPERMEALGLDYSSPSRTVFNRVYIADKIRAMLCYKSQINTGILDPYLMYVPERFYEKN